MAAKRKSDYTEILIRQGIISPEQLAEAQQMVAESGISLPEAMTKLGYATGEEVMRAMAEQHGLDYVNLNEVAIPPSVVELVPESVARENVAIPLSESDGKLTVIVSDPMDYDTFDKLRFILNRQIEIALAPREAILEAINRHYGQTVGESADSMLQEFTDTAIDFTETMQEAEAGEEEIDESSAPVVRLVQLIITEAVQLRASDIHIEPFEDRIRVRYRIDGVLVERDSPPKRLLGAILSRIKILSRLDIAERRRTQDGRIKVSVGEKDLDLRVSVIPTSHGQSVVMRILDKDSIKVGIAPVGVLRRGLPEGQVAHSATQRDHFGDRSDGLGQDDLALCGAQRIEHPRPEDHYGRGPGGILLTGGEPSRDSSRHRVGFCAGDSGDVASGAECDIGWRDARS